MINDPTQASSARQPRAVVRITGADASGNSLTIENMPGWIEWSVDNNNFAHADTFSISFAVSALPDGRKEDWFAAQNQIYVEIFAGFPVNPDSYTSAELPLLIYGKTDEMEFDPVARTLHLQGRDLTALMIDSVTAEQWRNKTSSAVATAIAQRHGLNTTFITPTTTKVGKYYQIDNVIAHDNRSEWDLLNHLARQEKFAVYVSGHDLHFEPMPTPGNDPYIIQWQQINGHFDANITRLNFSRNFALAKGIKVVVKAFNLRDGIPITATYPKNARKDAVLYPRNGGHTDAQGAQKLAEAYYQDILAHEVKMQADMPADNILSITSVIRVQGTGTIYDQIYYPESITRHMSTDGGYTMAVSAKNKSLDNEGVQ